MLRAFNKLPKANTAVILIVGSPGVGKHQLAKALLAANSQLTLEVRTAVCLPLPEDKHDTRPKIDFVVFMVDQTNRESFMVIKRSLQHLDPTYTMGRMCFVLTQINNAIFRSVSFDAMMQLAEHHHSQLLCCEMQSADDRNCLVQKIICKLHLSSGLQNGVTSLLVDCI